MAITFQVGFALKGNDLQQALSSQISAISTELDAALQKASAGSGKMSSNISTAVVEANNLQRALQKATTDRGLSLPALKGALAEANSSVSQMLAGLAGGGPAFQKSFNIALTQLATANRNVLQLSSKLAEAGRVFTQSLKFTTAQTVIRFLTTSMQQSSAWVKELDERVSKIAAVTGKTGDQLNQVYATIVNGAIDLRIAADEYAEAALIFYQQGLDTNEVERRTQITVQAARAAGQSVAEMASQLTAIWNTYKMVGDEQQRAASVGAKMAAMTAVDFKDIAEAMQISASAAAEMGVSYNSLAAIIATVGDNSQQSASIIGNAYKTIFSRFQQLKEDGTDGEVTLGQVSQQLANLGVNALDVEGKLKSMDTIIMELGASWSEYSKEQRIAIAEAAGGTRQFGQLLTLMNSFPQYLHLMKEAGNETGETLIQQFTAVQQTVEVAAENSRESWNRALANLFNADDMKGFYNGLEKVGDVVGEVIQSFGGLPGILTTIALIFQKQIADKVVSTGASITTLVQNLTVAGQKASALRETRDSRDTLQATQSSLVQAGAMSNEQATANLTKFDGVSQLKEASVLINRALEDGNTKAKALAQSLSNTFSNAARQYSEGIDQNLELKQVLKEQTIELQTQLEINSQTETATKFLGEEESARLLVLTETAKELEDNIQKRKEEVAAAQEVVAAEEEIKRLQQEKNKVDGQVNSQQGVLDKIERRVDSGVNDQGNKMSDREISTQMQIYEKEAAKMAELKRKQLQLDQQIQKAQDGINKKVSEATKEYEAQLDAIKKEIAALEEQAAAAQGLDKAAKSIGLEFLRAGENIAEALNSGKTVDYGAQISNIGTVIQNELAGMDLTGPQQIASDKLRQIFDLTNVDPSTLGAQDFMNRLTQAFAAANAGGLDLGISPDALRQLCLNAGMTEEAFKTLAQSLGIAEGAVGKFGVSAQKVSQSIVGTISGILSLTRGMENLVEGFMDGDMTVTKFLSSAMMLMMGLTSITSALKGTAIANTLLNSSLVTTVGGWAASALGALGFKAALDVATLGITAIISALMVGIGIVMAFFHAEEQRAEAEREAAEASAEAAAAMRELTDAISEQKTAIDEAITGLEGLKRGTAEYAEAAKTAAEAVQTLIDTLNDSDNEKIQEMGAELKKALSVAEYTGEWDALADKVAQVEKDALAASVAQNNTARENAETVLARGLKDSTDSQLGFTKEGNVTTRAKHIGSGLGGNITGDENGAINAYKKLQDELSHITKNFDGSLNIATNDTLEDQIAAYKEALKLQAEMTANMTQKEQQDSEVYSNLTDWLNENSAAYEAYTEAIKGSYEEQSQLLKLDPQMFFDAMEINPEDYGIEDIKEMIVPQEGFGSLSEYDEWVSKMEQVGKAAGWTEEQIREAIETNENLVSEMMAKDFIDTKAVGENAEEIKQILYNTYEDMSEKGLDKYFSQLDIDPTLTKEELERSLQQQINRFGSLELQAQVETHLAQQATYAERQKIVDGLETGDTISAEDFGKLGEGYSSFFKLMEDGTYQLIEDSELLANQIESVNQKILMDDATKVAVNAQQYKGTDNDLYNSMMESSAASQQQYLASADSLMELQALYMQLGEAMREVGVDGVSYNAYADALVGLASEYSNTSEEIKNYQNALKGGDAETIKAAENALEAATYIGECAEKYDLNARSLEIQAKEYQKANKEMNLSDQQAAHMAVTNQRLNKGMTSLTANWKTWSKELKKSDKTSQDWTDTAVEVSDAIADIVGWYEELNLSSDFLTKNMDLLEKAAEGDTKAILQLGNAVAQESIANAQLDETLVGTDNYYTNLSNRLETCDSAFEKLWASQEHYISQQQMFAQVQQNVAAGFDLISSSMDELMNGASLADIFGSPEDLTAFVENLNAYAAATGMTAQEMQSMLSSVGVTANVETDYVQQEVEVPTYYDYSVFEGYSDFSYTDDDGEHTIKKPKIRKMTVPGEPVKTQGYVGVAKIDMVGADGSTSGVPDIQFTGKAPPSTSAKNGGNKGGNKSGGGSTKTPEHKSKKAEKRTKLDDRYSTIKSKIDDVARALEDYSNAEDDAFGAAKLAAMQKQEQSLVQQAKHYKTLRQMALNYLKVDQKEASSGKNRTDLKTKLAELGLDNNLIDVQYDDDGYVANRTEIIQQLDALLESKYNVYKAAADAYDKDKSTNEAESERIDALKEEYEGLDKLVQLFIGDLDQVDETAAEARQALLDELEKIREWMQKKVDQANYKLELRIGINEMDIKMMELTIKLWDKLGVKMGSTFNNLHKNLTSSADSLQGMIENSNRMWEILNNISPDSEHQDWFKKEFGEEVWQEYLNGNGALPASVIENLEEKADSMLSELSGMYDTAEEMLGQFVEAMNMFLEDFDKIADKLARQNEKLDMFEELLDFSGKKYSVEGREAMMGILKARMDNAKVAVANAKAEQEFTKVAVEEAKASLEQFYAQEGRDVNSYDDTAAFFYNQLKNTLDEAEAAAAEAESNFYQSMQELTAAARAAIEESARIIEEELVDSLGGIFDSFDSGLDMYQHQDDMYNFFLDDYDKGYELKKLLGEIEDAMEDVTDPERLAEWGTLVDDINAANQDGVKITQTDLDILKARFDLQKAYDEYTDARAGKNTMRLQRDASGNYSYVYSSDNNSEADDNQQKIEDALHNIHKMHREAADEMQSMWFQTYVEMEKYISEVDQLRLQNDAKYAAEVEWYKNMYQQKLEHYRDQTIQHNAAIDRSYEETTLGVITGMEDMEGTHEWYMEQAHKYDEKLKESALSWEAQVRDTCNENGINYDNLEKVVKEDTDKMIDENKALKDEINRLKTEGTASLRSLGSQIRSFVSQGVSKLREMKRAVEELIQKLQELKRLQLAQENAKSSYYDETTDYSALGANLFREAVKRGEFSEDEYEKFLRQNSFIVDQVYAAQMQDTTRGQYYKGNDSSYSWEDALKHIIAAQGTDRTDWNFRDTSKIEVNGNIVITGDGTWDISTGQKIPETASGGLIVKEQVRSLAEEGPELVLNAEDTKNILEAVRLVRQNVEAQLGARMMTQMSELQKLAENVDYHRYGLDDQYKAYVDAAIAGQEQRVQIEANFPGVTVASEIEEAFNQLVTQAAQYRIRQDR